MGARRRRAGGLKMGVWGYGPFDNDTAGDMIAKLAQDVRRVTEAKTDAAARYRYDSARAAAQFMLLAHGTDILGGPPIEIALRALARMRGDTAWLASMREPKQLARELNAELDDILLHMRTCKGCRKTYRKRKNDFKELVELVKTANDVKVPKPSSGTWRRKNPRRKKSKKMKGRSK